MGHVIGPVYDSIDAETRFDTIYPLETTTCYELPINKTAKDYFDEYYQKKENYTIYILRFAHTLLTYAEATARAGILNTMSYEAVNRVRRRANKLPVSAPSEYDLTDGLTVEQFIDSVVWERAWEFVGEAEGRWFDLLRLEMIDHLDELRDPHEAVPPYEDILYGDHFFPIPEEDLYLSSQ
jgi:hypothetical protein